MNEALPVLYERHGEQVAVITLNRPEKNAINLQMAELIRTYLRQADNDDSVHAIVWPVNRRYFPPAWISTPFIRVNCPSSRRRVWRADPCADRQGDHRRR